MSVNVPTNYVLCYYVRPPTKPTSIVLQTSLGDDMYCSIGSGSGRGSAFPMSLCDVMDGSQVAKVVL